MILLAVLALSQITAADEPLELSRSAVVSRAAAQNPQVAAARAREAQSQAKLDRADAARWPIVTVQVGVGTGLAADLISGSAAQSRQSRYDIGLNDITATLAGQATVLQPLLTFGKIGLREDAASASLEARKAQTEMTRAEVALRAAELYEGWLFARATLLFFEEMQHRLEETAASTEERMRTKESSLSEQDLLRVRAALRLIEVGLHRARAGREKAKHGLRAYLGLKENRSFRPADQELEAIERELPNLDVLLRTARTHRPELRALRAGERARGLLADARSASYYPDVFLLGFASGAYTPERDLVESRYLTDPLYFANAGVLAGVRWSVQGPMPSARAEEAHAQAEQLSHRGEWASDGIAAEVRATLEDLQRAEADVESTEAGVRQAKQWLIRAEADYGMGLGASDEVTDAAEAYLGLRLELLRSRYRYNRWLAQLAQATGTLVGQNENPYLTEEDS